MQGSKSDAETSNQPFVSIFVAQIDTKDTDVDAVENGRPARPSSSPTTKSQVSAVGGTESGICCGAAAAPSDWCFRSSPAAAADVHCSGAAGRWQRW